MKRLLLLLSLLLHAAVASAQGSLEIIALKHRSAEQVIPILRPFLDSGGALSGQGYQLFVRTSARNLADLKRTLAAIDIAQRRLMISVRFETQADASNSGIELRGAARAGSTSSGSGSADPSHPVSQSRVEARVLSSRGATDDRVDQRVQVLEGARAHISTGHSRPLSQRQIYSGPGGTLIQDSTVIQPLDTGFDVVPRLSGNTVFLDINPKREVAGAHGAGSVQSQQASSSVSAQLGEWVELGSAVESGTQGGRDSGVRAGSDSGAHGALSTRDARVGESRRIWVRVEEVRP